MDEEMQAAKFKSECLKITDRVKKTRNIPVAKLGPASVERELPFGKLKGTVHFRNNIIDSIEESWNANL